MLDNLQNMCYNKSVKMKGVITMKEIKRTSKRGQAMEKAWNYGISGTLSDVYSSYSLEKEMAFDWCRQRMYEMNGCSLRIMSFNTFQFTVGFLGTYKGRDGLVVETASNEYFIEF